VDHRRAGWFLWPFFKEKRSKVCREERNSMDPLDSTAILTKAVQSVLQRSPISPAGVRRAELSDAEAYRVARTHPLAGETERSRNGPQTPLFSSSRLALDEQASYSPTASIHSYVNPIAENPTATIRKAEELLQIAAIDESSAALRRRIATMAYLMEIEAQRELSKIRREGLVRIREWFA